MIPVSQAFKDKINADTRYMEAEIDLIMRDELGNIVHEVTLTDATFSDFELLEEISSNEELPFGGVSANEFTFNIDNVDKKYTPSNSAGPYYGFLVPGVEVKARLGLEISPDVFEYIPLGTFYVAEWRAPSQGIQATVTAYDRLFDLRDESVPMLRVTENASVAELFMILFDSLGLLPTEYLVDATLTQIIPYGFIPQGKVSEALNQLSQAGMCTVSVDRKSRVIVKHSLNNNPSVVDWTDDDQIMEIDNPEKFNAVYGKAAIGIHSPSVRRTNALTNITNIEIQSGDTYFEKAEFSSSPVVNLEDVSVKNTAGTQLVELKYGTHQMSVLLKNPTGNKQVVSLAVTGTYCAFTRRELLRESTQPLNKKQLDLDNKLIQTAEHAEALMDVLLPRVTDPFALFELEVRGNPALEVGDVISVKAPVVKIDDVQIQIYRSYIRYDGSIDGSIVGRKVI